MVEFSQAGLKSAGFRGFVRFTELDDTDVPVTGGVYAVLRDARTVPLFLETNPGGRFKQKDPTVEKGATRRRMDRVVSSDLHRQSDEPEHSAQAIPRLRKRPSGRTLGWPLRLADRRRVRARRLLDDDG